MHVTFIKKKTLPLVGLPSALCHVFLLASGRTLDAGIRTVIRTRILHQSQTRCRLLTRVKSDVGFTPVW
jgi:hypothetical protein